MPPPKTHPWLPATAVGDFLDSLHFDPDMNPTPLGLVIECWYQLTYEESCRTLPPPLAGLLQQCRLHLAKHHPSTLAELRQRFKPPATESGTRSSG